MKRFLTLLFSVLMCFSVLAACGDDTDNKSTENGTTASQSITEDNQEAHITATEAVTVTPTEEVVVDNEICKIVIKGIEKDDIWGNTLKLYIENKTTDTDISVSSDYIAINGVEATAFLYTDVSRGKVANEDIIFFDDFDETVIGDFSDIEIAFSVCETDDYLSDPLVEIVYNYYPLGKDNAKKYTRSSTSTDTVLVDNSDLTVIVIGYEEDPLFGYVANLYLVNKTDKQLMFTAEDVSVNSIMIDPFYAHEVNPGKVAFSKMCFYESDFEENGIKDVEEIEFSLRAYDFDDLFADDILNQKFTLKP